MTIDLFGAGRSLEHLDLVDAHVEFARHIDLPRPAEDLLEDLIATTPWRAETITLYGKKYEQPRLIAWYGDPEHAYSYSGIDLHPLPWTATLASIRQVVENVAKEKFNSVLLNYYRDHRDSVGLHSDDERELGPMPVIASLSLGSTRTFILKHKTRPELRRVKIELPSGSLLVMKGATQKNWKHGIDKETKPCGPRVSLTFRRIMPR